MVDSRNLPMTFDFWAFFFRLYQYIQYILSFLTPNDSQKLPWAETIDFQRGFRWRPWWWTLKRMANHYPWWTGRWAPMQFPLVFANCSMMSRPSRDRSLAGTKPAGCVGCFTWKGFGCRVLNHHDLIWVHRCSLTTPKTSSKSQHSWLWVVSVDLRNQSYQGLWKWFLFRVYNSSCWNYDMAWPGGFSTTKGRFHCTKAIRGELLLFIIKGQDKTSRFWVTMLEVKLLKKNMWLRFLWIQDFLGMPFS